ncbi:MAG: response regulator [Candidatus Hydrogenedentes bacterium]|nr:response regulator [Candidatus Hydrogenedentota bacterium]
MKNETSPYRALVVDDDANVRELLRLSFEREGVRCEVAEDGIVAENQLRQRNFDVLVTDLRMPRKHGHQLITEVLAKHNRPMVIVITGVADPRIVGDLFARGVADVVSKPFDFPIFAVKVRAMLDRQTKGIDMAQPHAGVAGQIDQASLALQAQLAQITESFNATISNLTSQKEALEAGFLNSVRVFTSLIAESGHSDESHAVRVEQMAMDLADAAELTSSEKNVLGIAALLHDIGQFGMPDSIRSKPPWLLDPDERAVYCRYPLIGASLMGEMPGAMKIAGLIEQHSENFDGTGFPWNLEGPHVSISARIIRIADGVDTFLSHARGENAIDQVCEHIRAQRGKAYDPELVPRALVYVTDYWKASQDTKTVRVPADSLRPGLTLAENVYDPDGHFLARRGATLTLSMISHLRSLIGKQDVLVVEPESE